MSGRLHEQLILCIGGRHPRDGIVSKLHPVRLVRLAHHERTLWYVDPLRFPMGHCPKQAAADLTQRFGRRDAPSRCRLDAHAAREKRLRCTQHASSGRRFQLALQAVAELSFQIAQDAVRAGVAHTFSSQNEIVIRLGFGLRVGDGSDQARRFLLALRAKVPCFEQDDFAPPLIG